MAETLLKLRAEISKRRPRFPRNKSGHRQLLRKSGWRKPSGHNTKLRLHRGSRLPIVTDGFRGPVEVRGLHKSGKNMVLVHNMSQLLSLKPAEDAVIIADIGKRKKYDLIKKASELNFMITNVISVQKSLDKMEKDVKVRKHLRAEFVKRRTTKSEAKKKDEKKVDDKNAKSDVEKKETTTKDVNPKKEKTREQIIEEQQAKADLTNVKGSAK
jgi:large subunit ribosomal protein L32e